MFSVYHVRNLQILMSAQLEMVGVIMSVSIRKVAIFAPVSRDTSLMNTTTTAVLVSAQRLLNYFVQDVP